MLIKRHQTTYNDGWFSTKELDDILRKVSFNKSIMIIKLYWNHLNVIKSTVILPKYIEFMKSS